MSDSLWQWPALQGDRGRLPERLECQRGVFGKVQGARSDFRWIARSAGFHGGDELEKAISLGSEDKPRPLSFWRSLPSLGAALCYFAGFAYPSRAQDASGRSGFLEKQIAELGDPGVPAALAALLLLPAVRQWNDHIWWDRRDDKNWSRPESVLSIAAGDCTCPVPAELDAYLDAAIAKGVDGLNALETDGAGSLERCYAALLAGEKPAILYASAPLGPEELAALLLPFPRRQADTLSVSGWIPSDIFIAEDLGKCWDAVVLPKPQAAPAVSAQAQARLAEARRLARALLENRPEDLAAPGPPNDTGASRAAPVAALPGPPPARVENPNAGQAATRATAPVSEPEPEEPARARAPVPLATDSQSPEARPAAQYRQGGPRRPNPLFELDAQADGTDLAGLLYDFARRVRRRTISLSDLKKALPNGLSGQYEPNSPQAKQLAAQIKDWIKAIEKPPETVHAGQWEIKLAQLRVVLALLLDSPDTPALKDIQDKRLYRRFFEVLRPQRPGSASR